MVRQIVLLSLIVVVSFASKIINISYFPGNAKVDVLFSLDEPFRGKITQIRPNDYKITGVSIDRIEQKKINDNLTLIISDLDLNSVEFRIITDNVVKLQASLTAKGYGLRLRVLGVQIHNQALPNQALVTPQSKPMFNMMNYLAVIGILIVLIIILLILKKRNIQNLPKEFREDNYKVLYQRMIDPKNKIVLIEVFGRRYLLLLGDKNNILLDDFSKTHQEELMDISSTKGFDKLLEQNLQAGDEFIQKATRLKDLDGI
ncbi:MAG: FliO/MopB family protein [Epsilonproteobacteria bacterium]|nr:FliO/MopB family protein [Campylobacterota bacterium]